MSSRVVSHQGFGPLWCSHKDGTNAVLVGVGGPRGMVPRAYHLGVSGVAHRSYEVGGGVSAVVGQALEG